MSRFTMRTLAHAFFTRDLMIQGSPVGAKERLRSKPVLNKQVQNWPARQGPPKHPSTLCARQCDFQPNKPVNLVLARLLRMRHVARTQEKVRQV